MLCLCTLSLMWLQAGVFFIGGYYQYITFDFVSFITIGLSYSAITLLLSLLLSNIEQSRKETRWHYAFNELKYRPEVISLFKESAPQYETSLDLCSSLYFGDPNAATKVTVFSNPFCSHCADMHEMIKYMPSRTVGINYVFSYFSDDWSIINKYIIAAYKQLGAQQTWDLLSQWYSHGYKYGKSFFDDLNLNIEDEFVKNEFEKHLKWRSSYNNLKGTPTVLINGKKIVYPYSIEDYLEYN